MILTDDQIRSAFEVCPDCAKREITVQSHPSMLLFVHDHVDCPTAHALAEEYDDQPINVVEVLHDPGCPRLSLMSTQVFGVPAAREITIMPIELDDDSELVAKALGRS